MHGRVASLCGPLWADYRWRIGEKKAGYWLLRRLIDTTRTSLRKCLWNVKQYCFCFVFLFASWGQNLWRVSRERVVYVDCTRNFLPRTLMWGTNGENVWLRIQKFSHAHLRWFNRICSPSLSRLVASLSLRCLRNKTSTSKPRDEAFFSSFLFRQRLRQSSFSSAF